MPGVVCASPALPATAGARWPWSSARVDGSPAGGARRRPVVDRFAPARLADRRHEVPPPAGQQGVSGQDGVSIHRVARRDGGLAGAADVRPKVRRLDATPCVRVTASHRVGRCVCHASSDPDSRAFRCDATVRSRSAHRGHSTSGSGGRGPTRCCRRDGEASASRRQKPTPLSRLQMPLPNDGLAPSYRTRPRSWLRRSWTDPRCRG